VNDGSNTSVTSAGMNDTVSVVQVSTTADTFTYTLVSVTDANGCSQLQTGSAAITVDPLPGAVADIVGPSSICAGLNTLRYIVSETTNTTSYQWTYSDPGVVIHGNGTNMVTIDGITTGGTLSVAANNNCGPSAPAELTIEIADPELCSLSDCSRVSTFIDNEILDIVGAQDVFKAQELIESDATIKITWYKEYRAGQAIELFPGFNVEKDATFLAIIEGCE